MQRLIASRSIILFLLLPPIFLLVSSFSIWSQTLLSTPLAPTPLTPFSLSHKREVIKGGQLEKIQDGYKYQLEGWPLIRGSEKIQIDGKEKIRDSDYKIDYQNGEVKFVSQVEAVEPNSQVVIEYDFIPISLKRSYQRQLSSPKTALKTPEELQPKEKITEPSPPSIPSTPSTPTPSELSELNVSGSQTFFMSLGSGREFPPPLTQALHLNIEGKVAQDVSISALLSDQNLPIQPEGTTEEIQDLDQILIKITSPRFSAALGEYEARLGDSEFIFFPRNLQGAQAEVNFQKFGAGLLGAVAKGRSGNVSIQGVEGQNEYRIDVGGEFVIMIAGSETVWLNGERMKRGEANDYVIRDYGDPIIEFTNKHLITKNDIIRVDFEYIAETQSFVQDIYGIHTATKLLDGKADFGLSYAVESDDKSKQLIPLTETEIQMLRENRWQANDGFQKGQIIAPQSHSVVGINGNLNLGDSTKILSELALSQTDSNTFSVIDKPDAGKAWKMEVNSQSSKMRINLDFRNLEAQFLPVGATKASRTRYKYEDQYKNTQFDNALSAASAAPKEGSNERELELDIEYKPLKSFRLQGNLGRRSEQQLKEKSEFITNHWSRTIAFALPKLPKLGNMYQESLTSSGSFDEVKRSRQLWNFSHTVGKIRFSADNESVETIGDYDSRDRGVRGVSKLSPEVGKIGKRRTVRTFRVGTDSLKLISLSAENSLEENFSKESAFEVDNRPLIASDWLKSSTAVNKSIIISASPSDRFSASGNFSNRQIRNLSEELSESSVNLAEFRLNLLPLRRALQTDLNYQIDRKLDSVKEETYVKVLKGQGHYRKVDDLHYEEDLINGEYIRFVEIVGDKPVSSLEFQLRFRAQPGRIIESRKVKENENKFPFIEAIEILAKALALEFKWTVNEEQEGEGSKDLYFLRRLQTNETVFGRSGVQYRVEFSPSRKIDANFDYRKGSSLNKRYNDRLRDQDSEEFEFDLKSALTSKISTSVEWSKNSSNEKVFNLAIGATPTSDAMPNAVENRDPNTVSDASPLLPLRLISDIFQSERKGVLKFRYDPNRQTNLGLGFERQLERDTEKLRSTALLKTSALILELSYSIIEKGRLDISYRFAKGGKQGELPFSRFDFYEGLSHELKNRFEYRFQKFTDITTRANYNLIISQVQKPDHRLEMEMAAEF